ncbi:hypothetical protein [Altererythrobacter sp. ZODW24]|uniref:hypothetical protein n=1 Tax=Altererythrobacter sp. ZODW24 TaxID=2185142 RepID=UPI001F07A96F|nr:hypothetical protein [Altererythrobacter sp. ZODW24]
MSRSGDSEGHAASGEGPTLTDKQRQVMQRIDRRMPIKVIAGEMGVSETRINQHIRALKDIYSADSLNGLVEAYRAANGAKNADPSVGTSANRPYSFPQYTKSQVPQFDPVSEKDGRVATFEYLPADSDEAQTSADRRAGKEPQVVPRALDGQNAVLYRLAIMIGLAFGIIAAGILVLTAALGVSEVLDGKAEIPLEAIAPAE